VRGAYFDNFDGAIITNLIRPDGKIKGLNLSGGETLVVRDDESGVSPYTGVPFDAIPITATQSLNLEPDATLKFVLEADAWDSLISFDPNIPVERGGALELTFAADVSYASQIGRTFQLFDWSNVSPTGAFNVVSPYVWDLSNLYTTGQVTFLAASGLPGDFNHDAKVDAGDYVLWRKGLGTTYAQSAYNVWRSHFGQTAGSGAEVPSAGSLPAVPEPMIWLLLISGLPPFAVWPRHRKR
jgi:hypothetical protein